MCYSAMIKASQKKFSLYHNVRSDIDQDLPLQVRVFPFKEFPVVRQRDGVNIIESMSYSLVPSWSKVQRPKFATYNARVETLKDKPTWKQVLQTKRCLVSFTSFFESCYDGTFHGHVVEFKEQSGEIMTAAGLWNSWVDPTTGESKDTFAIITRGPSEQLKSCGHDRSPFFIGRTGWDNWLSEDRYDSERALDVLNENAVGYEFFPKVERKLKGY